MKTYMYLLFGFCIFFTTCKKEKDNMCVIGNTKNMLLNTYDTVLIGDYMYPVTIDLDIDGDKTFDFSFKSGVWGSPAVGHHSYSTMFSLNSNSLILGYIKTDTSYLHIATSTNNASNNTILIYNNFIYSCRLIAEGDSIINIQTGQFKLSAKKKGDVITKSDMFSSDTCALRNEWYSYPTSQITNNDTTIYNRSTYDYTCDMFPPDDISYIGIMIKDSEGDRLGWIKLSISDNKKISILESAIQK